MKPKTESINIHIMENEKNLDDWKLSDLARELYWWVDFFNISFFKDHPVPVPATIEQATPIGKAFKAMSNKDAY